MDGYMLGADGLVRHDGKLLRLPLDEPFPPLTDLLEEMGRLDLEAAQRFNRLAELPATTYLTAQPTV